MRSDVPAFEVIVVGGGPAGSALGRLLASWGHRVLLLAREIDRTRGLAESIPPSARKLLAAIGVLDQMDQAAFRPNRGNVAWWGPAKRVENFNEEDGGGWSVFRPDFDALLLAGASRAGADVRAGAVVRRVAIRGEHAVVEYVHAGRACTATARLVADCSGRAGVVARNGFRVGEPDHRMQAYLGTWTHPAGWPADDDRTIVETYEDGWAWSLATSGALRQVAVMVDGARTRTLRGPTLAHTYAAELAKTRHVRSLIAGAALQHVWARDTSMYSASRFAGPGFALVGDAACCIDPLSSFGVKKALSSAWLASVALHTSLVDPARRDVALDYFSSRERDVYAAERARTREWARLACSHHGGAFWSARAGDGHEPPVLDPEAALLGRPEVAVAHALVRRSVSTTLRAGGQARFCPHPVVRGREIVLEDALQFQSGVVRFAAGVDLAALVGAAMRPRAVPDAYEAYCQASGFVPLTNFLAAVSLLVSERALELSRVSAA